MLFGLYGVTYSEWPPYTDPSIFDDVAGKGFDFVHMYHDVQPLENAEHYLEEAAARGLMVMQNMPRTKFVEEGDEFWIEWVSTLAKHDNLLWWYMPEEPILRGYDQDKMRRLYEIIREHDPKKRDAVLYFGSWQRKDEWDGWSDCADFFAGGGYPEMHTAHKTRVYVWQYREALKEAMGEPILSTPFFADSNDFGGSSGFPSISEMRYDAYASVLNGATRMCWFYYDGGHDLDGLWDGLIGTIAELKLLEPVFTLAPNTVRPVELKIVSGMEKVTEYWGGYDSIQMIHKSYGNYEYIIACNLAWETVEVKFSALERMDEVDVLFENRSILIDNDGFLDTFSPNEVHVYKWSRINRFRVSGEITLERIE